MLEILFLLVALIITAGFILQAVFMMKSQKGWNFLTFLTYFSGVCLIAGITSFMAPMILTVSGVEPSHNFEWPVGHTNSALVHASGMIIVPHEPSGRVQIYDSNLKFLRGWQINAGGGSFILKRGLDDSFYVYTARGDKKYRYDLQGNIRSSESYTGRYPTDHGHLVNRNIPTSIFLWIFTHPFKAWFLSMVGILSSIVVGKLKKQANRVY